MTSVKDKPIVETWIVTVFKLNGSKEVIKDVLNFGPIPNTTLLSIVTNDGNTIIYQMINILKYIFRTTGG